MIAIRAAATQLNQSQVEELWSRRRAADSTSEAEMSEGAKEQNRRQKQRVQEKQDPEGMWWSGSGKPPRPDRGQPGPTRDNCWDQR